MPKVKKQAITLLGWLVSIGVGFGLILGISYLSYQFPLLLIILSLALIFSSFSHWRDQQRLSNIAHQRKGESICNFVHYFNYRTIDTWVIRAVYEQVQTYVGLDFPVRASDRLIEDLGIDSEDLDLDLAQEIAERTGRTLDNTENNPYYGQVKTVADLVLFFDAQPKK